MALNFDEKVVGHRLRSYRERQGWSLRTLSERCGLSINAISRIERGENSPTISSLTRLADALSIPITDFFIERQKSSATYIRSGAGPRTVIGGCLIEELRVDNSSNNPLESFLVTVPPGCCSENEPVSHPGEEFIYCQSGNVECAIAGEIFSLSKGDSLIFQAIHPHLWRNPFDQPAVILLVFQAAKDNFMARRRHQF